jgi:prepilin-type N-terminal cleavage/methylation domain-containing protein
MLKNRTGFTLVELSIALVIIGLLIGGILVGQSLIQAAKIGKEASRLTQYSIAFVNFRQKFKQEAGDSNLFSGAGNNNKTQDLSEETISAWADLSMAKMLNESFVWDQTKYGNNNLVGLAPFTKLEHAGNKSPIFYYYYGDGDGQNGSKRFYRMFWLVYDPEMIWGLDNKLDDGILAPRSSGIINAATYDYNDDCTPANVDTVIADYGPEYAFCETAIYFSPTLEMPLLPR